MEEIFKQVQSDPDVQFTSDDVEKWMEKIDDSQYNYLEGKTTQVLEREKEEALASWFGVEERERIKESLIMYRCVNNLQETRLGRYCRWLTEKQGKRILHGGGYLVKIIFAEKGVCLLCERVKKYKMQVKTDETVVFQKMTAEEWVVVMANDHAVM
jgi:hypothetical protein